MIISETVSKINLNSLKISDLLKKLNAEVTEVASVVRNMRKNEVESRITTLRLENENLEKQIENYKHDLKTLRANNGIPQIPIPSDDDTKTTNLKTEDASLSKDEKSSSKPILVKIQSKEITKLNADKEENVHFGRLDIRVGKIIHVQKHPNADSLYVEQVDVGEEKLKTILSGLVKYVSIEQMKDRVALFLCNLKPVKMRGISSEGMIMCANDGEHCEILEPPAGSIPGEVVTVEGFERKPDTQLNPKKKIFETIQLDLKTNDKKEATYKNISWNVGGRGPAVSKLLTNAIIK